MVSMSVSVHNYLFSWCTEHFFYTLLYVINFPVCAFFSLSPFCSCFSVLFFPLYPPTNHRRSLSLFYGGLFLLKGSSSSHLLPNMCTDSWGGGSSNILGSWVFTLPCRALWGSFRWELALYIKVNCQTCSCLWKREQQQESKNSK